MVCKHVELSNGIKMPLLGLGTTHNGGYNHDTVVYALRECGYRSIDTAKRYGVESYIGQAVVDSGVEREEIFITTKLWPQDYGTHTTGVALKESLNRLNMDYLDLYLMHWPVESKTLLEETWRQLELSYERGDCRAIGVSNFEEEHLNTLLDIAAVVPHVNQCEFHPYIFQKELRDFCKSHKIQFQGYCPLGKGMLLEDSTVKSWANVFGITPAQILLQWSIFNKVITIPKSTNKSRVMENSKIFDEFCLTEEAIKELNQLHIGNSHKKVIKFRNITDNKQDGYKLLNSRNVFPKSKTYPMSMNELAKNSASIKEHEGPKKLFTCIHI